MAIATEEMVSLDTELIRVPDHSDNDIDHIPETPPVTGSESDDEPEEGVDILEVAGYAFCIQSPVVTINLQQITF